jgi:hypothetical protein
VTCCCGDAGVVIGFPCSWLSESREKCTSFSPVVPGRCTFFKRRGGFGSGISALGGRPPFTKATAMKNKYNFAVRAAVLALTSSAAFAFNTSVRAQSPPVTLWYNGEAAFPIFNNRVSNKRDGTWLGFGQFSSVYDNFNVTGHGWNVTEVFSSNLARIGGFAVYGATWEIRSGTTLLTTGGTLVASGMTLAPIVHGSIRGLPEGYIALGILVTGLNVFLPVLPAGEFYWLNVTPIGDLRYSSWARRTIGGNCVGTPCGNDGNSFWNSNLFHITWRPAAGRGLQNEDDFSMGVNGTPR